MRPLDGITVIDITGGFAGPVCTYQLGLLGAEIIKVEAPGIGDSFRARPGAFEAVNAGKKSLALDMKRPGALAVMERLIRSADVIVDNLRPGAVAKLGVTWEKVQEWNPKTIWCSISGFGLDGPWSQDPAVEWTVQAASGLTASYVPPETHPQDLGLLLLDVVSGHAGATAVLAALRLRERTGVGQRLDVAMLDIAMSLLSPRLASDPVEAGERRRPAIGRFNAKDHPLMLMAGSQRWLEAISPLMTPPLLDDPRFADHASRLANTDALSAAIEERLASRTAEEWQKDFTAAGVPSAVVRTPEEAAASEHVRQRGIMHVAEVAGEDRNVTVIGTPYKLGNLKMDPVGPVPTLGGDTEAVLARFGYSADEVAALRSGSII